MKTSRTQSKNRKVYEIIEVSKCRTIIYPCDSHVLFGLKKLVISKKNKNKKNKQLYLTTVVLFYRKSNKII